MAPAARYPHIVSGGWRLHSLHFGEDSRAPESKRLCQPLSHPGQSCEAGRSDEPPPSAARCRSIWCGVERVAEIGWTLQDARHRQDVDYVCRGHAVRIIIKQNPVQRLCLSIASIKQSRIMVQRLGKRALGLGAFSTTALAKSRRRHGSRRIREHGFQEGFLFSPQRAAISGWVAG